MTEELRQLGILWAKSIMSPMIVPCLHPGNETEGFYGLIKTAINTNAELAQCDFEDLLSNNENFQKLDKNQKKAFTSYIFTRYEDIRAYDKFQIKTKK